MEMKFKNKTLQIGRVKIGCVVEHYNKGFGHIVGFALNIAQELILKVQWATGETSDMHQGNCNAFFD